MPRTCQVFQALGRIKISKTQALQEFTLERGRQTYQKAILILCDDSFNCSVRTEGLMRVLGDGRNYRVVPEGKECRTMN